MNTLGKTKDTNIDETYRQFIINCHGENDRRKYFSISSFGEDSNVPEDTRALTSESNNKDDKFVIGFLNKVKVDDLDLGEKAIFSTLEDGSEIKSSVIFRNTGAIEITADSNTTITINGDVTLQVTGDINLNADGNVVATATQFSANGNLTVD